MVWSFSEYKTYGSNMLLIICRMAWTWMEIMISKNVLVWKWSHAWEMDFYFIPCSPIIRLIQYAFCQYFVLSLIANLSAALYCSFLFHHPMDVFADITTWELSSNQRGKMGGYQVDQESTRFSLGLNSAFNLPISVRLFRVSDFSCV